MSAPGRPKRERRSLASHLSRTLLWAIGGLWLLLAAGAAGMAHLELEENMDAALVDTGVRLLDLALHDLQLTQPAGNGPHRPAMVQGGARGPAGDHLAYQVVNAERAVLLRSHDAPEQAYPVPLADGFTDQARWRIYTYRHPDFPVYIHMADSLDHRREALTETLLALWTPMLLVLPLLAWLVHGLTRRGLAAVGGIAQEIGQRSGSNLAPLPALARPAELQVIADSTNRLLLRLGDALDTERALAANAAHELRTPLAAAQLRLHALLGMALAPAQQAEAHKALDALAHLSRRAEKLLQLSRAESGAALNGEPVDLVVVAATVLQDFWSDPDLLQRLRLQLPSDGEVTVTGDVDTLAIVVRNLVENALRHAPGCRVDVIVEPPGRLRVRDDGAGVDPARIAQIRQRHVQGPQHGAGFGLGLSIVGAIVARHRGTLTLASPPPGRAQGFEACVDLPMARR